MESNKRLFWLAILAMLVLGGCATSGQRVEIPITMPNGSSATIYTQNETMPTWTRSLDSFQLSFVVKNKATGEQLAAVAALDKGCKIQTKAAHPHMMVSIIANGLLYGTAGAVGLYFGSGALPGVARGMQNAYGEYGGVASGSSGVASGVVSSSGRKYTYENCAANTLALFQEYARDIRILNSSPY